MTDQITKTVDTEEVVKAVAKKPLPALDIAMSPRGAYFICLMGTQEPFDADAGVYTEEKRARQALHTLKENW